jgi:hypothetical protein
MEDVIMTEATKEETKEAKDNSLVQEYRKAILSIEKAVPLKDTKTLSLYSRLLNKFRRGLTEEETHFICDNFLRFKFPFTFIPSLEGGDKVAKY